MLRIGFSTGALALGDFRRALAMLATCDVSAVELSALRLNEMDSLLDAIPDLQLSRYKYISFHAPTNFLPTDEAELILKLQTIHDFGWPIIVHPDCIFDRDKWRPLSNLICFENMDKRKPIGRTADELEDIFQCFPDASLCFDVGHASQVDRTMSEALLIAQRYQNRITQLHVSEVDTSSKHKTLSESSRLAFMKIVEFVPESVPLIIESVVMEKDLVRELTLVEQLFRLHDVVSAEW